MVYSLELNRGDMFYRRAIVSTKVLQEIKNEFPDTDDDKGTYGKDRWEVLLRYVSHGGKKSIQWIIKQYNKDEYGYY